MREFAEQFATDQRFEIRRQQCLQMWGLEFSLDFAARNPLAEGPCRSNIGFRQISPNKVFWVNPTANPELRFEVRRDDDEVIALCPLAVSLDDGLSPLEVQELRCVFDLRATPITP
ncbi:MAG: hypothetical protein NZ750_05660 [Anaerolineae bacterium]|nr:hypothetical protein [Anaerolineae bacterium]